jgi:hypothetical protein
VITDAIHKEMQKAVRRGWDKVYVFVDFHEVVLIPDYQAHTPRVDYYPGAKELLQHLSARRDICLIAWTCSHPHQVESYLKEMAESDISFDYVNENPEVTTDEKYGYYEDKPYYNILLDDKAGIVPETDLDPILAAFRRYNLSGQCVQCRNPWFDGLCECSDDLPEL